MHWHSSRALLSIFPFFGSFFRHAGASSAPTNVRDHAAAVTRQDSDFYTFRSRLDIVAPKWDVKVYNPAAVSPGHWFVAPYGKADKASIGPHIYDSDGELVWSGAPMLDGTKVYDFRVQNVNGKAMITFVNADREAGVVIDDTYGRYKSIHMGAKGSTLNIHDFNLVENGTKALFVQRSPGKASKEESMEMHFVGQCNTIYDGFVEASLEDPAQPSFFWTSLGHIGLQESVTDSDCSLGWDYLHFNSVDKFANGDYLVSGRFTGTIYRISATDGSVVWRLGGKTSDFRLTPELKFSAQGHARIQTETSSHTIISLMDNAILGPQTTSHQWSRGLLIALQTEQNPMLADLVAKYAHPHGQYAANQGNFQVLPSGNAFLGWRDQALQSEHTQDGKVVMEASLKNSNLLSYRNFKHEWVGRPTQPPDVYAESVDIGNGVINTTVYVSWNGATEVAAWNLYRTTIRPRPDGTRLLVEKAPKRGFETVITDHGYFRYVQVEALDKDGNSLAKSGIVESVAAPQIEAGEDGDEEETADVSFFRNPFVIFFGGIACGLVNIFVIRLIWKLKAAGKLPWWRPKAGPRYEPVLKADQDFELEDAEGSDVDAKENG